MTSNVTALPVPSFMNDIAPIEGFGDPNSIMIHSEPGKGKTFTLGEAIKIPGLETMIVIDIDNGTNVFLNDPVIMAAVRDGRIKIIKLDKTAPDAFIKFDTYFWEIINANGYGFKVVGLDTADVIQEVAAEWFLANTWNDQGNALDTRKAWGELAKWTSKFLWALHNNPNFLGLTLVHTKTEEEKKTKISTIKPKFQGSVKDSAAGIPDIVIYLTKEENEDGSVNIVADMSGVGDIVSKQRYSAFLPQRMDNFSLPKLYELIRSGAAAQNALAPVTPIQTEPAAAAVSA